MHGSTLVLMRADSDHSPSSAKMHESDNQVLSEVWMVYGASSVTRPNIPLLARSTWLDEFRSMHGGFGAQNGVYRGQSKTCYVA